MSPRERILEVVGDAELMFLEPKAFDRAIVGCAARAGGMLAVCYDTELVLEVLQEDGMSPEEAVEYFEFNVIGAWVGDETPVFLTRLPDDS